jgi:two-component system cell cycle sensor histidine kinase/response regulator CckA
VERPTTATLPEGPVSHVEESSLRSVGPLVLVVDDELTPRSIVSRIARALGYQVRSFRCGRDALLWLRQHPGEARILLADLDMPRMDGGELAERVLDLDPRLHVVLMVADEARDLLAGYYDLPWLRKPVSFDVLADRLEDVLGRPVRTAAYPPTMGPPRWRSSGQLRR